MGFLDFFKRDLGLTARLKRSGYRGDGTDELFIPYPKFLEIYKIPEDKIALKSGWHLPKTYWAADEETGNMVIIQTDGKVDSDTEKATLPEEENVVRVWFEQ